MIESSIKTGDTDWQVSTSITQYLWKFVLRAMHHKNSSFHHCAGKIPIEIRRQLHLPIGDYRPDWQPVALVQGTNFCRVTDHVAAQDMYQELKRTRVYEGVDLNSPDWYSFVCLQLAQLARCRVACSVYESSALDAGMVPHIDSWDGLIIQIKGAKRWTIGPGGQELVTNAGDLLFLPEGTSHSVSTPDYSVHLVFALVRGEAFLPAI